MKLHVSPHSSNGQYDPWEELERQRKHDALLEDEDVDIEEDVDDVEEDDYSDDDVE